MRGLSRSPFLAGLGRGLGLLAVVLGAGVGAAALAPAAVAAPLSTAGAAGEQERRMTSRLGDMLKQEQELQGRAKVRLPASEQVQVDRMNGVLSRADAVDRQLREFDVRIDAQADVRLDKVRSYLAIEKEELHQASGKLGVVLGESQNLGGGLAQAMFDEPGQARLLLQRGRLALLHGLQRTL